MKNFQDLVQSLQGTAFAETNGKIKQTQARTVKASLLSALVAGLDLEYAKVQKGYIVRIPNDEHGSIVVGIDLQVKPLDYDFDAEAERERKRQADIKAKKAKNKKSAK
jgi:hypothetical protein